MHTLAQIGNSIPYESIGLASALMIAVIVLWRFIQGSLKKRDEDRAEVVAVYQQRATAAEKDRAEMAVVINNNTEAMKAAAEQMRVAQTLIHKLEAMLNR